MVVDTLAEKLAPTVSGLGYELLGVERLSAAGGALLRLYIDHDDGIAVEDCVTVSRQVSDLLDVEQWMNGDYTLEVSSPGADRPLFTPAHYSAHVGSEVKLRLRTLIDGRRRITGTLVEATSEQVSIKVGEDSIDVDYVAIERGQLVPEW